MSTRGAPGTGLKRDSCRTVVRWTARVSFALLSIMTRPVLVCAQEHVALPPVNLGGSSFMDGVGGPGLLVREALGLFSASRFTDASGNPVPGQNTIAAFAAITLLGYTPPFK